MRKAIAVLFIMTACLMAYGQNRGGWRGSHRVITPSAWRGDGDNTLTCKWAYRMRIIIDSTDALSKTLTNYSIRIIFSANDSVLFLNSRNNGEDIRFRNSDGITELSFFQQNYSRSGRYATYWAKVDTVYDARKDTIWCYFGCVYASSASNGTNTFPLFEDFNTTENVVSPAVGLDSCLTDATLKIVVDTTFAGVIVMSNTTTLVRENSNVVFDNDTFRCLYSYQDTNIYKFAVGNPYAGYFNQVGYAYSLDGITWVNYGYVFGQILPGDTIGYEDTFIIRIGDTLNCYAERHDCCADAGFYISRLISTDWVNWEDKGAIGVDGILGSPTLYYDTADVKTSDTIFIMDEKSNAHIRMSWSLAGRTFQSDAVLDTVFTKSSNVQDYDTSSVVPDDIKKIGNTYFLTYHGHRSGSFSTYETMIATSASIRGPWTRVRSKPFEYIGNLTAMWYQNIYGVWSAIGTSGGNKTFLCYLKGWHPDRSSYTNFVFEKRGFLRLAWSPSGVNDTLYTNPSISTDNGLLYLYPEQRINGSAVIKTALYDTLGYSFGVKRIVLNWRTNCNTYASFGTDTLASEEASDWRATPRTGYWWQGITPLSGWAVQRLDGAVKQNLNNGGGVTGEAEYWSTSYSYNDMYYSQNYGASNQRMMGWTINDTLTTVAASYDNVYRAIPKLWMFSQGTESNFSGARSLIDWIYVRKMQYPEPTYTKSASQLIP